MALSVLALLLSPALAAVNAGREDYVLSSGANMNGEYVVSSGGGRERVAFNTDYASKGHEFFDVYSPEIATHYAEVWWTDMGNVSLPDDVVERFKGKTMAITGFEMDWVMDDQGQDVSVPINWAYNHHFEAYVTGEYSALVTNDHPDPNDHSHHGGPARLKIVELPGAEDQDAPVSQWFSEGNGGESRKSFHGYPAGFAQLIASPDKWSIIPMQIDTRNRDCGVTPADVGNCTDFVAGVEPRQARSGRPDLKEGSPYAGVLECPCTGRFGGDEAYYPGAGTRVNGSLCEAGGVNCVSFDSDARCSPAWTGGPETGGDLVTQRNPTCSSATYVGGLQCCGHTRILLDADQDPGDVLLKYRMKFRFWFQDYSVAADGTPSHENLDRYYFLTEAQAGEYDVPPAFRRVGDPPIVGYEEIPESTSPADLHLTPGTTCTGNCPTVDDCDCEHVITSHWLMATPSYEAEGGPGSMIYAGGHCHAPSCLSIELYSNETGTPELLCRQVSYYGGGNISHDRFDERGYVVLPPCLWGSPDEGLEPPVFLHNATQMFSKTRSNNTWVGHTGQMASWQMRGVPHEVHV
mmetsp:Transcript_17894/g.54509  ORF Transcript_17894/g.54509 Transcript_17894/m.54509 type:complete len:577 (-) Transcript_17894:42-1772(-)